MVVQFSHKEKVESSNLSGSTNGGYGVLEALVDCESTGISSNLIIHPICRCRLNWSRTPDFQSG